MTEEDYSMEEEAAKELMWRACWEGYKWGEDAENHPPVAKRAARNRFEQWFERNYE